tara:strand:+ start:956 stop:1294 length:339 start_codon:yes stop_codon:yes gene_type:complete
MAMSKEGEDKSTEVKGEEAFSTGYIAPTMEVINKQKYHLGGVLMATTDKYSWVEYEKNVEIKELGGGKKGKIIKLGSVKTTTQSLEGGFFLYRDSRTDKAYVMTKEGKVKKI